VGSLWWDHHEWKKSSLIVRKIADYTSINVHFHWTKTFFDKSSFPVKCIHILNRGPDWSSNTCSGQKPVHAHDSCDGFVQPISKVVMFHWPVTKHYWFHFHLHNALVCNLISWQFQNLLGFHVRIIRFPQRSHLRHIDKSILVASIHIWPAFVNYHDSSTLASFVRFMNSVFALRTSNEAYKFAPIEWMHS
jgi:hypothetical protein